MIGFSLLAVRHELRVIFGGFAMADPLDGLAAGVVSQKPNSQVLASPMGRSVFYFGQSFLTSNWVLTGFFIFSSLMVTRESPGEPPPQLFPGRGISKNV